MSTADLAIVSDTIIILALIGDRTHLLHRLAARIIVAAPPKPASNGNGAKAGTPAAGPETARTPLETPEVTG